MSGRATLGSAAEVVDHDLSFINDRAAVELDALAGKRLLITGGAGFLGYYLVQAALRRNRGSAAKDRIRVTVYDNYARGVPEWLAALDEDLGLVVHDVRRPLPEDMDDFEYIVHAAGIASPTYYRQHPIETIDANVGGLRALLDHARRRGELGRPVEGLLFYPIDYQPGRRYPLVVQTHGGPASSDRFGFAGGTTSYVPVLTAIITVSTAISRAVRSG